MTLWYLHVARNRAEQDSGVFNLLGPYNSNPEAHRAGIPYAEEGLDVEVHTANDVIICDFCSSPDVHWHYEANDFQAGPDSLHWGSRGFWAACNVCHDLVEANNRQALGMRGMQEYFKRHPNELPNTKQMRRMLYTHIRQLHDGFFENRTSGAVPE